MKLLRLLFLLTGCPEATVDTTVDVTFSALEDGCWATVTEPLDAEYWAPYADNAAGGCGDVAWVTADHTGRCLLFSVYCQPTPFEDPFLSDDAAVKEACEAALLENPSCEG
jgi:hypothetical protein